MADNKLNQDSTHDCDNACGTSGGGVPGATHPETTIRELILLKPETVRLLSELGVDTVVVPARPSSKLRHSLTLDWKT